MSAVQADGDWDMKDGNIVTAANDISHTELDRLNGLTGIITTDATAVTDLEGTGLAISGSILGCTDASDDGVTKGCATFEADDFILSSGKVDIDYANGQAAATGVKGFLTGTDWDTFNGKAAGTHGHTLAGVDFVNQGTTTTVLHGNAAGNPSWSQVSLTAAVSGILPVANGGTGMAYWGAAGPTTARTYTFPDSDATVVTAQEFNAQTILLAVSDDTPTALTITASSFVGRKASGDAGIMSVSDVETLLSITATPTADSVVKAEGDGDIAVGWIPLDASYVWTGTQNMGSADFSIRESTDCDGLTDGVDNEPCWDTTGNTLWVCTTADTCDSAGEWKQVGAGGSDTNAVREICFDSASLQPLVANDAFAPLEKELGTNHDILERAFDSATDECVAGKLKVPSDVSTGSTLTYRWLWRGGATSGSACWDFKERDIDGADDDWDGAALAADAIGCHAADTSSVDEPVVDTDTTTPATLGWAANDWVYFQVCRDADNGSDNLAADAYLHTFCLEIPRA
jgi:hypothetical protein